MVEHRFNALMNDRDVANAARRAHDQRHPLVRRFCRELENAAAAGGRGPSGPLHHQRHRMRFVQEPQSPLAIAGTRVRRIKEHTAANQNAKRLGHQRADPAHVEIRAAPVAAGKAFVDIGADRSVPVPVVRRIDREFGRVGRDLRATDGQQELAGQPIENEDIDAPVERQDQRGLRAVNREPRGALRGAGLEEGGEHIVAARTDREDRSDRDIVFKIGRSIERIDRDAKRRPGIEHLRQFRFLGQNGGDRRDAQRTAHHLVGGEIDILLQIAVGIDAALPPGDAGQRPVGDEDGKVDRRSSDRLDHGGDRGPVRCVLHRAVEMRTQGRALVHWPFPCHRPLRGHLQSAMPVGSALVNNTPVCKISEIFLSLA